MSIADSFSIAIDSIYTVQGESATYTPRGAAASTVTVVHGASSALFGGLESGVRQAGIDLSVRASDVAEPKRGDTITLADGTCHEIRDAERINRWEWGLVTR